MPKFACHHFERTTTTGSLKLIFEGLIIQIFNRV